MTKSQAGQLGGLTTLKRYGKKHMSEIGKQGARVFWETYTLSPIGLTKFAIVNRKTRIIKSFTRRLP